MYTNNNNNINAGININSVLDDTTLPFSVKYFMLLKTFEKQNLLIKARKTYIKVFHSY